MPTYRVLVAALLLFSGRALVLESVQAAESPLEEKGPREQRTSPARQAAQAADFRVDNTVYVDGKSQPQSQGVTIFHKGAVYTFLKEPAQVIVFDKAHRQFLLLDMTRHVRSAISLDDVQDFVKRVGQRLSVHPNPNVKWLADPSFEESFDHENSELTLKGSSITYQAQVQPTLPAVAAQYREFSDWYAKFNQVLDPKSWSPFPRMELNAAIERHQGIAKEVHLTAALRPKDPSIRITSRHQLVAELDQADIHRMAQVREYLRSFPSVSFDEFRQGK